MSLPTGIGTTKSLDTVFGELEGLAFKVKALAQTAQARAQAGNETAERIVEVFRQLGSYRTELNTLATGVDAAAANAFAQDRYNDPTFNLTTEYQAVVAQINAVLTWIETNADATTLLIFDANNGAVNWNTYTTQQLTGYSNELGSLLALID